MFEDLGDDDSVKRAEDIEEENRPHLWVMGALTELVDRGRVNTKFTLCPRAFALFDQLNQFWKPSNREIISVLMDLFKCVYLTEYIPLTRILIRYRDGYDELIYGDEDEPT